MWITDCDEIQKIVFQYILIPALQGAVYIRKWLCPEPEIETNDGTLDVMEGELIRNDTSDTHSIKEKHLEGIHEGMKIPDLIRVISSLENIPYNSIKGISLGIIYNDEYITKEYKIETDPTLII